MPSEKSTFIFAFLNGMELNKDKVFTVKQTIELAKILFSNPYKTSGKTPQELVDSYIQSIQQPTEIEVTFNPDEKDSEGCLILKKI